MRGVAGVASAPIDRNRTAQSTRPAIAPAPRVRTREVRLGARPSYISAYPPDGADGVRIWQSIVSYVPGVVVPVQGPCPAHWLDTLEQDPVEHSEFAVHG